MNNLFQIDSKPMLFAQMLFKLMLLNTVTIIASIPIITMGTALSAMHAVCLRIVRNEDPAVLREFWKVFRNSFRRTVPVWLCILLVIALLVYDIYLIKLEIFEFNILGICAFVFLAVAFGLWSEWYIILHSRYDNTIRRTAKNANLLSIRYLWKSIIILLIGMIPIVLIFSTSWYVIFVFFFGFSGCGCLQAKIYEDIFRVLEESMNK